MNNKKRFLAFPYIIWMAAFIIIPLLMVVYYGVTSNDGGFTFENIGLISSAVNRKALGYSLGLSALSTIICLVLAYPSTGVYRLLDTLRDLRETDQIGRAHV